MLGLKISEAGVSSCELPPRRFRELLLFQPVVVAFLGETRRVGCGTGREAWLFVLNTTYCALQHVSDKDDKINWRLACCKRPGISQRRVFYLGLGFPSQQILRGTTSWKID